MMEELIRKQLVGADPLQGALAKFQDQPAVFYREAPQDKDAGWKGKTQYPMLLFDCDDRYDPERKTSGTLLADILCTENTLLGPEDISPRVIDILSDLFLSQGDMTVCIVWNREDAFTQARSGRTDGRPVISGQTVTFDLLAFPAQSSINPDPIKAINEWTKDAAPGSILISHDSLPEAFRATDSTPAIYWRTASLSESSAQSSYACAWMDVQLAGHIMLPSPTLRQQWIRTLTDRLSVEEKIKMPDGSPLLIRKIAANTAANPLTDGQISVSATFGVLRNQMKGIPLNNIIKGA